MVSEPRTPLAALDGTRMRDWSPNERTHRQPAVAVGLGVITSLLVAGLAFLAGALVVQTVSAAVFRGESRSGSAPTAGGQQSLQLQRTLVEQRRTAVAAYAAKLVQFRRATARQPGAIGINLDSKEATRRDGVLTGLVLDCIDAVDRYNLAAQARSATQLQSAGLPASYEWRADCAPAQ